MPNISKLTLPNNETYNLKDLRLDNYGTCSTAAGTVAKTVTVNNSSFALVEGVIVTIKFTITNTAANPTLNVNSTSAKPIYYKGAAIQAGLLQANKIYTLIYNGTQYQIIGDIDQNAEGNASISISNNIITLTNASGQTSSITLPVYSGAVSGGAS